MRRYGSTNYGQSNPIPARTQPMPFPAAREGDFPPLAPPDIVPRRPTGLIEEIVPNAPDVARIAIAQAKAQGSNDWENLAAIIKATIGEGISAAWDKMRYADFQSFAFTLTAGVDQTLLERAPTKRVYLTIVNNGAANPLQLAFGRTANATDFNLPAGGGGFEWLFMIPQNPVHAFSAVGTTGICIFAELPLPEYHAKDR